MRKCNAVFNGIVVSLLTVCAAFMYTTCEVGLGNSVDTQPPAVTIAYPPEAAVIRGQFVVNGTASDETFVKSVAVVFTSTEQESKTYGPYQAEINKESKTWAVRLNAQDASSGSYAIPDGKYAVTVTAADSASRTSVATTVYEIDNTAPVLYVQRPGSRDETSPDTYGSSVSVSGQVYDAHLISKLTFSVFEKNPDGSFSRKGGKTIENVAPNISVVLADFDDKLDSLYTSLYGSDKNAGEKTFYCTVSVEDEARPYTGSADTSGGNKSAGYYLYDEVSALVSAKDLYTARSSGSLLADGVETSLSAAFIGTTDETDVKGVFSLDPAVSPKWTVINLSVFETGYLDTDAYKVPAGSSLTIRVEPSLNNSAIVDDSLAVYVQRCDRSGTVSAGAEKIYLMKKADDCTPEERIERKNAIKTVGSNRTLTINSLAALPVNTAYRLFAEGTDAALNIVAAANDAQYGFFLEGNGAPPEITLDGLSYYTNPAGQFSLSGSCTSQTGDSVTLIIALSGGSYLKETTVNSGAAWNFPFTAAELLAKAEETGAIDRTKSKTYSLEVRAQSGISTTAIKNCSVYYDAENPIPEIASVTPQVSANGKDTNVNGVILCKGTASDEDKVETSVLKLYTSADGASGWTPVAWTAGGGVVSVPNGAVNDAMRFSYAVDTKAVDSAGAAVFGDKKYLKLEIVSTDRSGNTGTAELVLYVDQSTDNPVVTYFNVSGTNTLFGYSGNNTILGTITDDDGLASVELYVDAETVPRKTFAAAVLQGTKSKAFEYDISADIPTGAAALAEGSHKLYFKITDTEGLAYKSEEQPFVVDTAVPLIAVTAPVSGGFAGKDVTVKGTASDTRGVAKVEYKQIDTTSGAVTWTAVTPKTAAADGSAADWSEWSYPITGQADTGVGAGYTRVFRATDLSGRTAETSVTYKVDTISPAFGLKLKFSGYSQDDYPGLSGSERVWLTATAQTLSGTMTEVNPGQINFTVTGATDASGAVSAVAGTNSPFRTTIMFEEGESSVTFTSQDTAGNAAIPLSRSVYVDATPPVLSDVSLPDMDDSRHITNGGADITVKLTASDAVSGVNAGSAASKVVELGSGAGFKTAVFSGWLTAISGDGNENRYTLTVPAETIRALGNGVHTLYVRVADKAGNKSEIALPELTVDLDAPTVSYTTPAANSVVNKKITLKGTVSDANMAADAAPALYVWNPAIPDWQSVGASGSGCAVEIDGLDIQPVSTGSEWTVGGFNTAAAGLPLASDGSCKLQVRFTDRAGNSPSDTAAQTLVLTVDQHKDRPTVKISNVNLTGMSEASPVWLKQTRTLFGTVSDDDGACTLQISENDGVSFTDVSVDNGSWNYALSADGVRTVVFKVTDSAGTVFTSAAAAGDAALLDTPILSDGTHSFGEKGSTGSAADSRLHIKVDTKVPEIRTVKWQRPSDSQWLDTFPTEKFGGTRTAATLRVTAWDDNGIKSVVFLKSGTAISTLTSPSGTLSADEGGADYWSASVPTNSGDGYQEVTIKVTDTADLETTRTVQINVDNTAPTVNIDSHAAGDQVKGEIVLKGTTDGAASLRYAVASSDSAAIDWTTAPEFVGTSFVSWRIYFDGKSVVGETHGRTMNDYLVSLGLTSYEAIKDNSYTALTDLFIYLRAVDECGNENVQKLKLVVDPQGDRPTAKITYPERDNETLGGTIRVTGTAEDNSKVSAVYVQIDPDYNGETVAPKLAQTDWDTVNTKFGTSYTLESFGSGTAVQNGFKATGTLSWNFSLNTKGEFDPSTGTRQIALRVYAVDDGGNISQPVERIITVDKDTPLIGSSEKLYLRKYANSDGSGTPIASVEYTDGMWINGSWYLEGSVEDASGIKTLTVTNEKTSTTVDSSKSQVINLNGAFGLNSGYRIKIQVGSETADSFGELSYIIEAVENTDKELRATKTIRLNYDNKAPVIRQPGASGFNISDSVVNSNGFYTLGSAVNEDGSGLDSQSGFSRVVFYFERTLNDVTSIYDPMLKPASTANKVNQTDLRSEDGLWWKVKTVTRDSNLLTALTLDSSDENIRSGGIVKIGGAIYRITNVSGTAVTIDGSPVVSETEALFAVAQVADNLTTETPNTASLKNENGYYPVVNDDGDGMVEGVTKIGTEYVWEASINSKNIPDGPVTIRYVVFDKAGNHTVGSVSGTVSNNRPRIAGVSFGTDDNGNGIVDDTEFNSAWSGLYANSQAGLPNGYSSSNTKVHELNVQQTNGTAVLKIKGKTVVRPEIVGGNNSLAYTYTVTKKGVTTPYYTQTVPVSLSTEHSDSDDIRTGLSDIALTVKDFLSAGTTGTEITDADDQRFSFTLWDATDGTVQGQNSQYARINMVMDVALRDTVSPTASIRPFYWNGKSDNSLYLNSLENGHIELGSDLPADSFKDSGTGVNDRDPKVSGKVVVTGTANDNNLLSELYIKIPGLTDSGTDGYKRIAYRDGTSGSWTAEGTLDADGWQFVAESDTFSQTAGNTVTWKLYWDTAKITNRAAADVEVRVQAVDRGTVSLSGDILKYTPNAPSAESNVQTKDDALTSYYRVDVVPYVIKLTTNLSKLKSNNPSVYNRTALGRYPVNATETVSIAGFNLEGADVGGTSATGESYANGVVTVPVTSMKTGALELTVNGIGVLNNRNSNTAEYNKQPNGDNNNLLTDDVELDVWEFDSAAAKPVSGMIEQPVMKINPSTGTIGFAFVNGPLYFSMGGSIGGTEYSAQYWMGSYDFFTSVGFAYDKLGYSYGCAAGGDINSAAADKFQFMTSRWGRASTAQEGSYNNTNSLRLESIGQKDTSDTIIFDKQRIKSPSFATAVHGTATNVYLAYYDNINDEIRFKYGSTSSSAKANFGSFTDYDVPKTPYTYRNEAVSVIAGNATGRTAGEYVSIAAVSAEGTSVDDVVAAVWYDASNRCLWYSYNTTPTTNRNGTVTADGWSAPERVFGSAMENAGEYCQIIADKDGGIHIAAYDPSNLDLVYAYKSSYGVSGFETCVVDGYGVVGSNLTLDVAKSSGGSWIPYIGYYATSCVKPKYAYKVDVSANAPAGTAAESFTGAWEITVLPTTSQIPLGSQGNNRMNVAVWKDSSTWSLQNSVTGTKSGAHSGASYDATCWDRAFGNGTANPVLGYAIKTGTTGFIETAQKR